jgi:hypothetical protein
MILGMTPYTLVHVVISLIGILSGFVVLFAMFKTERKDGWTILFLASTVATSVTGFGFPFHGFTPAIGVGIVSMVALIAAIAARYRYRLGGWWRLIYVIGAVVALYLNCFVLVAQFFAKIPALHELAPNGNEPPFGIAQGIVLLFFIVMGVVAARRFHPGRV